jgi:hypothetical protein
MYYFHFYIEKLIFLLMYTQTYTHDRALCEETGFFVEKRVCAVVRGRKIMTNP